MEKERAIAVLENYAAEVRNNLPVLWKVEEAVLFINSMYTRVKERDLIDSNDYTILFYILNEHQVKLVVNTDEDVGFEQEEDKWVKVVPIDNLLTFIAQYAISSLYLKGNTFQDFIHEQLSAIVEKTQLAKEDGAIIYFKNIDRRVGCLKVSVSGYPILDVYYKHYFNLLNMTSMEDYIVKENALELYTALQQDEDYQRAINTIKNECCSLVLEDTIRQIADRKVVEKALLKHDSALDEPLIYKTHYYKDNPFEKLYFNFSKNLVCFLRRTRKSEISHLKEHYCAYKLGKILLEKEGWLTTTYTILLDISKHWAGRYIVLIEDDDTSKADILTQLDKNRFEEIEEAVKFIALSVMAGETAADLLMGDEVRNEK